MDLSTHSPARSLSNKALTTKLVPTSPPRLVDFAYRTAGAPPAPTFKAAFRAGFLPFPGLTMKMINRYLPDLPATAKGHLDRSRQGLYSSHRRSRAALTAQAVDPSSDWSDDVPTSSIDSPLNITVRLVPTTDLTGTTHGDLTGHFPFVSRSGYAYMMVMLHEELNYIHIEPMRSRSKTEYLRAFQAGLDYFRIRGIQVTAHRLDNECSADLAAYCKRPDINISLQFVPPDCHRANRAERAIRTWKNHFITHLCLADPRCPLDIWDRFLDQAEMTLNLMRACGFNNKLSAWAYLRGPWSYNKVPLAPLGTKVVVFEDPKTRPSWATHGIDGWYTGPAHNHHHEFSVYIPSTGGQRTTNTLSWYPHDDWTIPTATHDSAFKTLLDTLDLATAATSPLHSDPVLLSTTTSALASLRSLLAGGLSQGAHQPLLAASPRVPAPATPQRVATPILSPTPMTVPVPAAPQRVATPAPTPAPHPPVPTRTSTRRRERTSRYANTATSSPYALTAADLSTDGSVLTYRSAMNGPDKPLWEGASAAEFNRLIETWQCIAFCPPTDLPPDRKASYYNPQVKTKMVNGKLDYRVRGTFGGNLSDYSGDVTAHTADLSTIKCHLNSTLSTPGARYMTADIKDFYLGTPMDNPEWMWVDMRLIPDSIVLKYDLTSLARNGRVLARVDKGIYGLPQAGLLAQQRLIAHMAKHGYHQSPTTPCLFTHEYRPISAVLVVDDFGVKYVGREHAEHLMAALGELYTMKEDWDASKYVGLTLAWHYDAPTPYVEMSMPGYVERALK